MSGGAAGGEMISPGGTDSRDSLGCSSASAGPVWSVPWRGERPPLAVAPGPQPPPPATPLPMAAPQLLHATT
jgi:hypothetical protein